MIPRFLSHCVLLCPVFCTTALAAPLVARAGGVQEEGEKPDKRPEIAELITRLCAHADKRGKEDKLAVEVIDSLLPEFQNSGPKDRGAIVKALDQCFDQKRQETEEGAPDNQLYLAAATALGSMGPESAKVLIAWIDHKSHRQDMGLQRALILSLGKTKDASARKPLVDLLPHRQASMQAAAAEALGQYKDEKQVVRKELFEAVLKELTGTKNAVDTDANDIIARDRYDTISAAMITALQELSKHEERDPAAWQRWWNKNKKEDWDKASEGGGRP